MQRRFAKYARPVIKRVTDMPLPENDYFQAIENLFNGEAIGYDHLKRLSDQIYGPRDPLERFYTDEPYNLHKVNGHYHLQLKLPFATQKDIELSKLSDELIIRIGSFKRQVLLPKQVAAHEALRARIDGQHLNIIFEGERHGH